MHTNIYEFMIKADVYNPVNIFATMLMQNITMFNEIGPYLID